MAAQLKNSLKLSFLFGCIFANHVFAQGDGDPPNRVARLNLMQGAVSMQPAGADEWVPGIINRPFTTGDFLFADTGSRAELHLDTAVIRMNEQTSFGFLNLGDQVAQLQLSEGELQVHLRRLGDDDVFEVVAFPVNSPPAGHLEVSEWIFHRSDEHVFQRLTAVREIPAIIQNVEFNSEEGQSFYNRQLARHFGSWNWQSEKKVIPQLPRKSDFVKDGVQVEVEFGNARTYYQDYVKFMLAYHQKTIEFGILITGIPQGTKAGPDPSVFRRNSTGCGGSALRMFSSFCLAV